MTVLLGRAVEEGEIPPPDIEYVADAILAPLNIDLYLFQRHERKMSTERIIQSLGRFVLDGLRGIREEDEA